jgi:hypothetical protein
MDKVVIYRFKALDIHDGETKLSERWGVKEKIAQIPLSEVLIETGIEVDASVVASDIQGLTSSRWMPSRPQTFQTKVPR